MAEVAVTIPTFRRPGGLERLLKALGRLDTQRDIKVIVADNDASEHEGADLCHRLIGENYRWTLDAIVVPERGIAEQKPQLFHNGGALFVRDAVEIRES